ncbi:hypothetical protein BC938DRAFT_479125 [Jimgerdemannia flammicorona]|uniref:UBC core domain-containing protein n=1 Tax=Jimgerdemannia flammicorona TaxID=994334 RepID=A0A433QLH1_9FUNG|nr:hypothetical protein BC938DRAFT_479125 [Jimgerdemannia flammicorona]
MDGVWWCGGVVESSEQQQPTGRQDDRGDTGGRQRVWGVTRAWPTQGSPPLSSLHQRHIRHGEAAVHPASREGAERLPLLLSAPPKTFPLAGRPLTIWRLSLEGAADTLYAFQFTPSYPLESPEVVFMFPNVPVHPHHLTKSFPSMRQYQPCRCHMLRLHKIYSNGHICLNILYKDWSPVQTVAQVCLSILSMLSSSTRKVT